MNFESSIEILQKHNELISSAFIWLIIFIISTCFLLKEIRREWQKRRIKRGLDDKDNILCPSKNQKDRYTGLSYKKANREIFGRGIIVSLFIFSAFLLSSPVKRFSITNIQEIIGTAFYAIIFFSTLTSIEEDISFENKDNKNILNNIVKLIRGVHVKNIEQVVSQEIIYIKNFIKDKVEEIYKDKRVLGCLVVRLNDEFLNGLIDDNTENYEEKKTNIQESCLKLLNLYKRNELILLDELTELLRNKLPEYSVPLYQIIEYIRKTEMLAETETAMDYIDKHIKENLDDTNKKARKVTPKSDIMRKLMGNDTTYDETMDQYGELSE